MTTRETVETALIDPKIRRLWAPDKRDLIDHFERLDPTTRRMRFGAAVSREFVKGYAEDVLSIDCVVYGAFVDGTLRGVGELRSLLGRWPPRAEAALSVESAWQAEGIGDALFARMVAAAQNRGVRSIYMLCLRENNRMVNLAKKHHAYLKFETGDVEATLDPPWPTPFSMVEEMVGSTSSYLRAVFHLKT
ncbi:MAG: GNAT family N-acetyltransferase [Pseudomonadota bacterium]